MEIMDVLWEHGAVTLAEAHQALAARRPLGYTTVQTRLNRLVGKGVVSRTRLRPARYEAIDPPNTVGARHIDVLLERIRGFRVVPLVAHLIRERQLSPEEVAELKRLITEVEESSRRT
jgi:predicted transcriptional regulator